MIAFIGVPVGTNLGALYVVANAPGSTAVLLEDDPATWISHPMWSPDSSTIVFNRGGAPGNVYGGTVETIPAAGGTPTVLHTPSGSNLAYRPSYSFDGSRIAFMLGIPLAADELWIMDADGSNAGSVDTITAYRLDGSQHAWANTQDVLAYENGAGAARAYVINGDGTGKTEITADETSLTALRLGKFAWLPDDSGVIVVSDQGDGYFALYNLDPSGGTDTRINFTNGSANQAWMRQPMVFERRVWFIEVASGASGGKIGSTALDGSDYVEELDVNDDTLLDDFSGGTGFEFQ